MKRISVFQKILNECIGIRRVFLFCRGLNSANHLYCQENLREMMFQSGWEAGIRDPCFSNLFNIKQLRVK